MEMSWLEIRIEVAAGAGEAAGEILREAGSPGTVIEDAATRAFVGNGRPPDRADPGTVAVRGYLPAGPAGEQKAADIRRRAEELAQCFPGTPVRVSVDRVSPADWEDSWRAHFHAFEVGERFLVCPVWEDPPPGCSRAVIRIDPGAAFGTGEHPTTRNMLRFMEEYLRPGSQVLDVGTGSGILAVAAVRLGASEVRAVDRDPEAVRIARRTVRYNGMEMDVVCKDLLEDTGGSWDAVLANLVAATVIRLTPQARGRLSPGGLLLVSGILQEKTGPVEESLDANGFRILKTREENGWVTMAGRRT